MEDLILHGLVTETAFDELPGNHYIRVVYTPEEAIEVVKATGNLLGLMVGKYPHEVAEGLETILNYTTVESVRETVGVHPHPSQWLVVVPLVELTARIMDGEPRALAMSLCDMWVEHSIGRVRRVVREVGSCDVSETPLDIHHHLIQDHSQMKLDTNQEEFYFRIVSSVEKAHAVLKRMQEIPVGIRYFGQDGGWIPQQDLIGDSVQTLLDGIGTINLKQYAAIPKKPLADAGYVVLVFSKEYLGNLITTRRLTDWISTSKEHLSRLEEQQEEPTSTVKVLKRSTGKGDYHLNLNIRLSLDD